MLSMMLAQVTPDAAATASGIQVIGQGLAAGGPYALSAVLLLILWRLWKKLEERDAVIAKMQDQYVSSIEKLTAAVATSTKAIEDVTKVIEKCPGSPGKKE